MSFPLFFCSLPVGERGSPADDHCSDPGGWFYCKDLQDAFDVVLLKTAAKAPCAIVACGLRYSLYGFRCKIFFLAVETYVFFAGSGVFFTWLNNSGRKSMFCAKKNPHVPEGFCEIGRTALSVQSCLWEEPPLTISHQYTIFWQYDPCTSELFNHALWL